MYQALGEVVSRKRKLAELGVNEEGVHGLEHGYEPSSLRRRVESTSVLNNEVVESFRFFDQAGKKVCACCVPKGSQPQRQCLTQSVELRTILDTFVGLNKRQSLAALKTLAEEAGFHNDEVCTVPHMLLLLLLLLLCVACFTASTHSSGISTSFLSSPTTR